MDMTFPTIPSNHPPYPTNHIADKVLRRAQVAKVARSLQDRLALANFKAQNGWQHRTLRTIEPEVTERLRRKRSHHNGDILSDTSSTTSDELFNNSSPLTTPAFSDEMLISTRHQSAHYKQLPVVSSHPTRGGKRLRSSSHAASARPSTSIKSWKQARQLPQSSPVFHRPRLPLHETNQSFLSDAGTIRASYRTRSIRFDDQLSPDGPDDLPIHSFDQEPDLPAHITSSPPRTPSPSRRSRRPHSKEPGADLLLYFANSPSRSPAFFHDQSTRSTRANAGILDPPSTPPSQHTSTTNPPLPSSFLSTPNTSTSGADLPLFSTPGQTFNFADFVNVTPSPAQVPWGSRTPGTTRNRTPAAMRANTARRGLNFDALLPPVNTPTTQRDHGSDASTRGHGRGLALELGDKLLPRS